MFSELSQWDFKLVKDFLYKYRFRIFRENRVAKQKRVRNYHDRNYITEMVRKVMSNR